MSGNKSAIRFKNILHVLGNIIYTIILLFIILTLFLAIYSRIKGEHPSVFGYRIYYVASGSMTPTIPVGSIVIVKEEAADEIKSSDIITFKGSSDTAVTHRVAEVSKDKQSFTTRGDANNTNDPMQVSSENLIGKVLLHVPFIGFLLQFLKSKYGLFVIMAVIAFMIILNLLLKQKENKLRDF